MYVKSKHSNSVSIRSLQKVLWYTYLSPKTGYYDKIRSRFGARARVLLNTETALSLLLRSLPDRHPGMLVLIDVARFNRFEKIVTRLGLKPVQFDGEKELIELAQQTRVLAIVVPDNYAVMHRKHVRLYNELPVVRILYQNRKRPKQVELEHDVYIWEPRHLPRSSSGAVLVVATERLNNVDKVLKEMNYAFPRLKTTTLIAEIFWAVRGKENRFRRVDRRPPKVLARMLYDFYN